MARRISSAAMAAAAAAALVLLLAAAAPPARAALSAADSAEWRSYISDTKAAGVGRASFASALGPVLIHDYTTPLEAVQAANVYAGGGARLRRVVSDLAAGRPVTIVALGGQATNGNSASAPGRTDYFTRLVGYLAKAFPHAPLRPVRAAVGLAPSAVVMACLDKYLPADAADIILLEMAANDGATMDSSIVNPTQPKAYEMLVRKLMGGARQPAVILTQVRRRAEGCVWRRVGQQDCVV